MDWSQPGAPCMRRSSIALAFALLVISTFSVARDLPVVDSSVQPGDAFFQYVNGAWLKATEIPPDRSSVGDDVALTELNNQRTLDILEEARTGKAGAAARKISDYYYAFMDEWTIERKG